MSMKTLVTITGAVLAFSHTANARVCYVSVGDVLNPSQPVADLEFLSAMQTLSWPSGTRLESEVSDVSFSNMGGGYYRAEIPEFYFYNQNFRQIEVFSTHQEDACGPSFVFDEENCPAGNPPPVFPVLRDSVQTCNLSRDTNGEIVKLSLTLAATGTGQTFTDPSKTFKPDDSKTDLAKYIKEKTACMHSALIAAGLTPTSLAGLCTTVNCSGNGKSCKPLGFKLEADNVGDTCKITSQPVAPGSNVHSCVVSTHAGQPGASTVNCTLSASTCNCTE